MMGGGEPPRSRFPWGLSGVWYREYRPHTVKPCIHAGLRPFLPNSQRASGGREVGHMPSEIFADRRMGVLF